MPIFRLSVLVFLGSLSALAQQGAATGPPLDVRTTNLDKAYVRRPYHFELRANGGITPVKWRMTAGALPPGLALDANGDVNGLPAKAGSFSFTVTLTDSGNPPQQISVVLTIVVATPLSVRWSRMPAVSGYRVDGAIKVSNETGEDFDLTMIVLAVNEFGRATAIGYQHFPLKKNTIDFEIPFGDNLPFGSYNINVDVVAEAEAINSIFRGRLAAKIDVLTPP